MSGFEAFGDYDGMGLAELVQRGEVQASELAEEAISRIEKVNPDLNAVIEPMYDQARQAAGGELPSGPFQGVPFLIKDVMGDIAGVPSRRSCRFLKDYVADFDSEIVRRHRAAGLVIAGKTNVPELSIQPFTEPELFGPTCNPWDLARNSGGSSGGSAAAVAARLVPLAHGNDGGGSIRIPASCCGVFGLKPTRGRTPSGPAMAEGWQGMSINHGLTRTVRDSAALLDATAGPEVGAPYYTQPPQRPFLEEVGIDPGRLRIAFTTNPLLPGEIHADCVKATEDTAKLCQELGHELVEDMPKIDGAKFAKAFLIMVCGETRAAIIEAEGLVGTKASSEAFEPTTWSMNLLGQQFDAGEFAAAVQYLKNTAMSVGAFFEEYDLLLTPTLATPPPLHGSLQPSGADLTAMKVLGRINAGKLLQTFADMDALAADTFAFIPHLPVFNATGQPAMSVPLHWNDEGLPIGSHFAARYGAEATLFRLAAQLEEARPWFDKLPPVHA